MARKSRKNVDAIVPEKKRGVAVYLRLSREDIHKKGDSLENQRHIIEQHLLTLPELGTPTLYVDNGYTGRNSQRPQFQKMLEAVQSGEIDCVIVKDCSRLGRNSLDTTYYIDTLFPLNDVRFISVTDGYDSFLNLDSKDSLTILLKNMVNESYSIDLSKKVKASKQQLMKSGCFIGSKAPLGYRISKGDKRKLEVDPLSSLIVKEIYKQALISDSLSSVTHYLNKNNVLTPTQYYHRMKNCEIEEYNYYWQIPSVKRILISVAYIGHLEQGKIEKLRGNWVPIPKENHFLVKNTHEPIISEEDFKLVQKKLKQWENRSDITRKGIESVLPVKQNSMFHKKLYCGVCGKALYRKIRSRNKVNYNLYLCCSSIHSAKESCSSVKGIRIEEAELCSIIGTVINRQVEKLTGKNTSMLKKEHKLYDTLIQLKMKLSPLEKEVETNQFYLKGLYENVIKGNLSSEEYQNMKSCYEKEIYGNKEKFLEVTHKINEVEEEISILNRISGELSVENLEITKEILNTFIEKIIIFEDKKVEVQFKCNFPVKDEVSSHD